MKEKYNSLAELRAQKAALKKEVEQMQGLLTFKNPKDSLSALTNGFTDEFLTEQNTENGTQLALKTSQVVKGVAEGIKKKIVDKNTKPILSFENAGLGQSVVENALRLGIVSFVGSYTRKKLYNSSWKNRLIGLALVYVVPMALRFIREKLEENQEKSSS